MIKILLLTFTLMSVITYAGEKTNAKVKYEHQKVKLVNLPQINPDKPHKYYHISFETENGKEYHIGINTKSEICCAANYIYRFAAILEYSDTLDYKIEVKRLSSVVTGEKSGVQAKKPNNSEKYIYYREYYFNQKYNIKIYDLLDDKTLVYDKNITFKTFANFPNEFINPSYTVEGVDKSYARYIKYNGKSKFLKVGDSIATLRALNDYVKKDLNQALSLKRASKHLYIISIKTKIKEFDSLYLATDYMKNGVEIVASQHKTKVYKNSHSKEAYMAFDKAYQLYHKYNDSKYIDLLTGDAKNIYKNIIRLSEYNTAFLTSRFDRAFELYKLAEKDYEVVRKAEYSKNLPTLKISNEEFCLLKMKDIYKVIEREKEFYDFFKEKYKYYK